VSQGREELGRHSSLRLPVALFPNLAVAPNSGEHSWLTFLPDIFMRLGLVKLSRLWGTNSLLTEVPAQGPAGSLVGGEGGEEMERDRLNENIS